jgi:hypothetical protein
LAVMAAPARPETPQTPLLRDQTDRRAWQAAPAVQACVLLNGRKSKKSRHRRPPDYVKHSPQNSCASIGSGQTEMGIETGNQVDAFIDGVWHSVVVVNTADMEEFKRVKVRVVKDGIHIVKPIAARTVWVSTGHIAPMWTRATPAPIPGLLVFIQGWFEPVRVLAAHRTSFCAIVDDYLRIFSTSYLRQNPKDAVVDV